MTSLSSRSHRSCRSPRGSRACPNRRPHPRRAPCPRQPGPSSGSRSPCRRNRDGGRSPATPRTTTHAGSRPFQTPGHARPRDAPGAPGTGKSSSGSVPLSAPSPDASPRMAAPAAPREAPSQAPPGTAAGRTRKVPEAPGCGTKLVAEATGSSAAAVNRSPRAAHATSPAPGNRCARGRPQAPRRYLRREGCRAPAVAAQDPAGLRHPARKRVVSLVSPSVSPNRDGVVEPGSRARWRHLYRHRRKTRHREEWSPAPAHCRAWGENRPKRLHRQPRTRRNPPFVWGKKNLQGRGIPCSSKV